MVAVEQAVAGPLCSRHLADLGADVVKVERPGGGDFARSYDSVVHGWSTHFVWLNRGKRSVELDLKSAAGRAALRALLQQADVLISNLGQGALERIVDLEQVRAGNPGLVSCAISGYGPDGPYAGRKAFDLLVVGEAGVTLSTGTPDQPAKPGVSLADLAGGIYAMAAVTAALLERSRTGIGGHVDIALFDVMVEWMMPLLLAEEVSGRTVPPAGMHHATITPYGPYRCADGRLVNIAVQNDAQWQRLCRYVLRDDELADSAELATNAGRLAHRAQCETRVQQGIGSMGAAELEAALTDADVPWGRLNTAHDVLAHPQLDGADRWDTVVLPGAGEVRVVADPFRFRGRARSRGSSVPVIGGDTAAVLAGLGPAADSDPGEDRAGGVSGPVGTGRTDSSPGTAGGVVGREATGRSARSDGRKGSTVDSSSVGWGIVGLGRVAGSDIAPAINAAGNSRLVGVVSRDAGRAKQFAQTHGAQSAYDDYDRLLADPDVDVVYIATPNALHADQAVAAARAGKHVLCDKPLATSVAEAERVVAQCAAAGVQLGITFQTRNIEGMHRIREVVASGEIGRVVLAEVEMSPGRTLLKGWRTDPSMAGLGTTNNLGVHAYDLLRYLLGSEVVEVCAAFGYEPGLELDTLSLALLRFDNDALAYVNVNQATPHHRPDLVVHGTTGRILGTNVTRSGLHGEVQILGSDGEQRFAVDSSDCFRATVGNFADAVLSGHPVSPSGLDGLASVRLVDAIAAAAHDKRTVQVGGGSS